MLEFEQLRQSLQLESEALAAVLLSLQAQQESLIAQQPAQIQACSQACADSLQLLESRSQARATLLAAAGWPSVQAALAAAESQDPSQHAELLAVTEHLQAQIPRLQLAQYTCLALIQQGQALTENTLETLVHLQQQQVQPATYSEQGQQNSQTLQHSAATLYDFNV